jgi:hypothetical protein
VRANVATDIYAVVILLVVFALYVSLWRLESRWRRERARLQEIADGYERDVRNVPPGYEFRPTPYEAELWRSLHPELDRK